MLPKFHWTEEFVSCNLCGQDDYEVLFAQDQHAFGLRTVICRGCGLVYLNPRPKEQDYGNFYRRWYHRLYPARAAFNAGKLGHQITAETARIRSQAYAAYFGGRVCLLEAGPGEGAFLDAVRSSYPHARVRGVDLSPVEVESCRGKGLDVIYGSMQELPLAYRGNTHIALFHVLEHTLDPLYALRQASASLELGGYLFVEVPNIYGSWRGLGMIHIAHAYQFSPATLAHAIQRAGLEVISMEAIEEPLLPSNLRAIAKRTSAAVVPMRCLPPDLGEVKQLFAERLRGWQRELWMGHLKRSAAQFIGKRLTAFLWEQTTGRGWKDMLQPQRTTS